MDYLMVVVYSIVASAFEWHCAEVHHEFFVHGASDCPEEDMTAYIKRVTAFSVNVNITHDGFAYGEAEWLSVTCGR